MEIVFFDVGQGDAILVRSPQGQTALIDAGPGGDLRPILARWGVDSLDLVVASHPHADHIGGMQQIIETMPVRFYMDNGRPHTTAAYLAVLAALRARPEITYLEAVPRTLRLGSVSMRVLPLPSNGGTNENNSSVGLVVEYGEFRAFLSGDSERPELDHFLASGKIPDVTLLKAPHHGSDDAVSEGFLLATRPEVVAISVGRGNDYGHPSAAAVWAYQQVSKELLRTDLDGEIVIRGYTDGSYRVGVRGTGPDAAQSPASLPETDRPEPMTAAGIPTSPSAALVELCVFADAPGNDHRNLNGEYAFLTNRGPTPLGLCPWALCALARHCFEFPSGPTVAPSSQAVVYAGSGVADGIRFFMGRGAAVWNNNGDTAALSDPSGRIVATHVQ